MPHRASVKARIVAIGNSQGIRIPKPLLERAGLTGEVELHAEDGSTRRAGVRFARRGRVSRSRPTSSIIMRTAIVALMTSGGRAYPFRRAAGSAATRNGSRWITFVPRIAQAPPERSSSLAGSLASALDANEPYGVPMIPELPSAVPEIPVSDITAATVYYRDKLSFSLDWVEADIALAGISRDKCRLFLAGPSFRQERGNVSPVLTWLNLSSKAEVDDLHRAWRATKAILLSAPESKPWRLYEFTAADPDGNLFRVFYDFATPEREWVEATAP